MSESLAKLPPERREDVEYRAGQGEIPALPEDIRIERDRLFRVINDGVFLPLREDAMEPGGVDPQAIQNTAVIFTIPNPGGSDFLEIVWKTH